MVALNIECENISKTSGTGPRTSLDFINTAKLFYHSYSIRLECQILLCEMTYLSNTSTD